MVHRNPPKGEHAHILLMSLGDYALGLLASAKYTRYPLGLENLRTAAPGALLRLDREFESKRILERHGAAGPQTLRTFAFVA